MNARMFFSTLARQDRSWDAPLSAEETATWNKWLVQLPQLDQFIVPRCIKVDPATHAQLHVFSDASANAYAAAAYLRTGQEGKITTRLVAAKAHVVQGRNVSVPRMELLAAELGVKLRLQLLSSLKIHVEEVIHWSDSRTALYWIYNDKHRLQAFVYNRVVKILRSSQMSEWRWVPTDANPADYPTKGWSMSKLNSDSTWLQGPAFLSSPPPSWPTVL